MLKFILIVIGMVYLLVLFGGLLYSYYNSLCKKGGK